MRRSVLQYFYDRLKNASSLRGKKGVAVKMQDVKSDLKAQHGFKDQQIVSSLAYLIDQKLIGEEAQKSSFTKGKMSFERETKF